MPRGLRSLARDLEALQSHRTLCCASSGNQTCFCEDRCVVAPESLGLTRTASGQWESSDVRCLMAADKPDAGSKQLASSTSFLGQTTQKWRYALSVVKRGELSRHFAPQ